MWFVFICLATINTVCTLSFLTVSRRPGWSWWWEAWMSWPLRYLLPCLLPSPLALSMPNAGWRTRASSASVHHASTSLAKYHSSALTRWGRNQNLNQHYPSWSTTMLMLPFITVLLFSRQELWQRMVWMFGEWWKAGMLVSQSWFQIPESCCQGPCSQAWPVVTLWPCCMVSPLETHWSSRCWSPLVGYDTPKLIFFI